MLDRYGVFFDVKLYFFILNYSAVVNFLIAILRLNAKGTDISTQF